MYGLVETDNQPVLARWGDDALWITDLITPKNPSVQLRYRELTQGIESPQDRVTVLWHYVSHLPYKEAVSTVLTGGGKSIRQVDTWLFPSETMVIEQSNCANKSFLLASLLKNEFNMPGQVYCSIGTIKQHDVGNHAWVTVDIGGEPRIIETTQPNLSRAFIPLVASEAYSPVLHFDENKVFLSQPEVDPGMFLNNHFGVCAVGFLKDYLCEKCLELEG